VKPISIERSLKNALASSAMEGFPADDAVMQDCLRLLRGETDINALIAQIKMQNQSSAAMPVMSSTFSQSIPTC